MFADIPRKPSLWYHFPHSFLELTARSRDSRHCRKPQTRVLSRGCLCSRANARRLAGHALQGMRVLPRSWRQSCGVLGAASGGGGGASPLVGAGPWLWPHPPILRGQHPRLSAVHTASASYRGHQLRLTGSSWSTSQISVAGTLHLPHRSPGAPLETLVILPGFGWTVILERDLRRLGYDQAGVRR